MSVFVQRDICHGTGHLDTLERLRIQLEHLILRNLITILILNDIAVTAVRIAVILPLLRTGNQINGLLMNRKKYRSGHFIGIVAGRVLYNRIDRIGSGIDRLLFRTHTLRNTGLLAVQIIICNVRILIRNRIGERGTLCLITVIPVINCYNRAVIAAFYYGKSPVYHTGIIAPEGNCRRMISGRNIVIIADAVFR